MHHSFVTMMLPWRPRNRKIWSGWRDSNPRPPDPQSGALPGCATSRSIQFFLRFALRAGPTFSSNASGAVRGVEAGALASIIDSSRSPRFT
jgi:hypothetical protein